MYGNGWRNTLKEIAVVSGKGGTGKSTLVSALSVIAENKVIVDCDVDAADMYIMLKPDIKERHKFSASKYAYTDLSKCTGCGLCKEVCRFDAVNDDYSIDRLSCEGCEFCARVCPVKAIEMRDRDSGEWFVSETKFGPFVHAKLGIAEENSGKLVNLLRIRARVLASDKKKDYIIMDGPPGTGCAVISTLTGAHFALVVAEPTISGLSDMKRVVELIEHFKLKAGVVINKYNINPEITQKIKEFSRERGLVILGEIPFTLRIPESITRAVPYPLYRDDEITQLFREIWEGLKSNL